MSSDDSGITVEPSPPPAPFTYEDADVILRSVDAVDFRVHKIVLSLASTVFKDMFQAGHSTKQDDGDEQNWKDGLAVVSLTEPHDLLQKLLSHIYPLIHCDLADEDILPWIETARKYDIEIALNTAKRSLAQMAETTPLRAFAYAARFELWTEAKSAALASLKFPFDALLSESAQFEGMSGPQYGALLLFHKRCSTTGANVIWNTCTSGAFQLPNSTWANPVLCSTYECLTSRPSNIPPSRVPHQNIPSWALGYLVNAAAELEHTPMARVDKRSPIAATLGVRHGCSTCRPYVQNNFESFLINLQSAVDKAISEVRPIDLSTKS